MKLFEMKYKCGPRVSLIQFLLFAMAALVCIQISLKSTRDTKFKGLWPFGRGGFEPAKCVETGPYVGKVRFTICVKPPSQDGYISVYYWKGLLYDKPMVDLIISALSNYPNSTLIDLGANIGSYTLPAAVMGHEVVAVDPVEINLMHIQASLDKMNIKSGVKLMQAFVSDTEGMTGHVDHPDLKNGGSYAILAEDSSNVGQMFPSAPPILPLWTLRTRLTFQDQERTATSITLPTLLTSITSNEVILKLDVQGYECKALRTWIQSERKIKYVPYILLEWSELSEENCPDQERFVDDFEAAGYKPFSPMPITRDDLLKEAMTIPNVLWIHKDAKELHILPLIQDIFKEHFPGFKLTGDVVFFDTQYHGSSLFHFGNIKP